MDCVCVWSKRWVIDLWPLEGFCEWSSNFMAFSSTRIWTTGASSEQTLNLDEWSIRSCSLISQTALFYPWREDRTAIWGSNLVLCIFPWLLSHRVSVLSEVSLATGWALARGDLPCSYSRLITNGAKWASIGSFGAWFIPHPMSSLLPALVWFTSP